MWQVTDDQILTIDHDSLFLQIHKQTLALWRERSRREDALTGPPWFKVGHRGVRYLKSDLVAWAKGQREVS